MSIADQEAIAPINPPTPSTESSVEISPGIGLPRIRISIPPLYSWCIILLWSLSNQLGTILTVKHLEVQLQDLPTYYGLNSDQNIVGHGTLAGGWICVYVPEGTALNKPFPDYGTGKDNYTFYEPNQFVLGAGTWLEGWQIYQTADIMKVRDAGSVGISQVPDICAGNNMRIKVPLSKKLNPGDAIYMIYYVVHTPNLQNASVSGCSSVVKYASKAN